MRFLWQQRCGSDEDAAVCVRITKDGVDIDTEAGAVRDPTGLNMAVSGFQKLTVVSCVLLCVALLLPKMLLSRGKRDGEGQAPAGQFPPMPARASVSEQPRQSRAHNPEARGAGTGAGVRGAGAGVRGAGTGVGTGGKSNLAGQIIPIYGFAILLYILYILFKITSKGKTTQPAESRFTAVRSQNTQRKITDFELAQLQDRLNETKDVIERIISSASVGTASAGAAVEEEQQLLQQLQEITRVMQEGRLVDSIPANTGESCGQQWDDLPADSREEHFCCVHSPDLSTHTPTRGSDDPEETPDANSQSQPAAQAGSDITESEHGAIRRRTRPCY